MGTGRRAYNLLRAYIGREWERIEGVFERDARKELDDYLSSPRPAPQEQVTQSKDSPSLPFGPLDKLHALKILGLKPDADLEDLKRAYKRLSERSLPTNFPEGSDERRKAAQIHVRVQEAYDLLLPILDSRFQRFNSLELD